MRLHHESNDALKPGTVLDSNDMLKLAVSTCNLHHGAEAMVDNTTPDAWFLKCKDPTCTFELRSTWTRPGRRSKSSKVATDTHPNFKINAFSSHTCFGTISTTNTAANAEYIANMASNDSVYKVVWFENSTHMVDFISKKYCCNGWQNDGYPCTRSLAVYLKKHVVPFDGIAKIHSLEYYKNSY
ncbi:hypothetical protein P9112_011285 [Eukaryota sp. TZLM1-RC]